MTISNSKTTAIAPMTMMKRSAWVGRWIICEKHLCNYFHCPVPPPHSCFWKALRALKDRRVKITIIIILWRCGVVRMMCVAGSSAVCSQANKRKDHSSFSKSGNRFILFKQTKSQLSQFFLPFFQSHLPILIQCNAGRKEHLYRSQTERFARQQNRRDVYFLARLKYAFLDNHKTD